MYFIIRLKLSMQLLATFVSIYILNERVINPNILLKTLTLIYIIIYKMVSNPMYFLYRSYSDIMLIPRVLHS